MQVKNKIIFWTFHLNFFEYGFVTFEYEQTIPKQNLLTSCSRGIFVSEVLSTKPGHSDWCKIPPDGLPISSGTLAGDLGGITIWTPWSNLKWCNLEGRFWYINLCLISELGNYELLNANS